MKRTVEIINGTVVQKDRIIENGEVILEDGLIKHVGKQGNHRCRQAEQVIDANGGYIIPGFIDMHSDAIEKEMEPRPGAFMKTKVAFCELEKKLVGQGITTMYHSFSFAGAEYGVREDRGAAECIRSIVAMANNSALIHNKIHLRFEITNYRAVELIRSLLYSGDVDLLSFMDHTPGQGQYPTIEDYRRYLEKTYHAHYSDVEKILSAKEEGRGSVEESISILQAAAQAESIPLASHDDDSPDRIRQYKAHGVTISEFPINIQTAVAAHFCGMDVCVGAPNIIRGGSTGKGLRAIEGIESGAVNMLCSDYYPPAILHAVFQLAKEMMSLPEAVAMATLAPAKALGLNNVGSISEGKKADIIVVGLREQVPVVTNTVVNGIQVYDVNYRTKEVVERLSAELPA